MPLHNGLFVLIPKSFLFFTKPENYNVSAWIIEKLYLTNPESYGAGTSATLIGASYIYGGLYGVIIVFLSISFVVIFLENLIDSYFFLGFYIYFISKLGFCIFRMDETFFIPSFIPFIILTLIYKKFFENYIYCK